MDIIDIIRAKMKKTKRYDYGMCEVCGFAMREELIAQDFWIRGKSIVVRNVPVGVCGRCGKKVVGGTVARKISVLLENSSRLAKARKISVPALEYEPEEVKV